jgi:hypothetical protein
VVFFVLFHDAIKLTQKKLTWKKTLLLLGFFITGVVVIIVTIGMGFFEQLENIRANF